MLRCCLCLLLSFACFFVLLQTGTCNFNKRKPCIWMQRLGLIETTWYVHIWHRTKRKSFHFLFSYTESHMHHVRKLMLHFFFFFYNFTLKMSYMLPSFLRAWTLYYLPCTVLSQTCCSWIIRVVICYLLESGQQVSHICSLETTCCEVWRSLLKQNALVGHWMMCTVHSQTLAHLVIAHTVWYCIIHSVWIADTCERLQNAFKRAMNNDNLIYHCSACPFLCIQPVQCSCHLHSCVALESRQCFWVHTCVVTEHNITQIHADTERASDE